MGNPTKAELLEQAKALGIEVTEEATNKEVASLIQAALENQEANQDGMTDDIAGTMPLEGTSAEPTRDAGENRSVVDDDKTVDEDEAAHRTAPAPEVTPEPTPVPTVTPVNEGSEIARAIAEGLKGAVDAAKDKKNIVITADPSVTPRYSLVRNKQGEVLLRENGSGTLSRLQLESIEEKERSIQGQEVTEI
jgi:hypothetical protein